MSISDVVRVYLKQKPYAIEAINSGIVNFSALARTIQKELKIKNYHAVKIAIIRYAEQMRRTRYNIELKALSVLKENRVTLLDGMSVVITNRRFELENVAEVRAGSFYVYLTTKNVMRDSLRRIGKNLVRAHENCSVIALESPEKLEGVPGVMAFLTSVLAEQEINLIELISCYTQTIMVIDKNDALRSYQILSELTHQ